jgi:predicted ribosome quality control (RQC) complex YloA/Tae2 family protein
VLKRLLDRHVECAQAVAKKAADDTSTATVSPDTPNVLQSMIQLRQDKSRSETTNNLALETEKERDTAEKTVEELKRQLQPKRSRTDDDADDVHEMITEVDNWDLRDHRQQATRVENRHHVQVGSRKNQVNPHTGTDGFLHHTSLGLVGWISYWCLGDSTLAVDILVTFFNTLGLTELVSDALAICKQKEVETKTKIVDLFKDTFDEIKNCRTEQQRVEFHIARSSSWAPASSRSTRDCSLGTVTEPSWLTCGSIEWMKMSQV